MGNLNKKLLEALDSLNESSLNEKVNDSYDVKVDLAYMLSKYVEEEGLNIDFKSSDTISISKENKPLCDIKFVDYKTKISESKIKDTSVNESDKHRPLDKEKYFNLINAIEDIVYSMDPNDKEQFSDLVNDVVSEFHKCRKNQVEGGNK